MAVTPMGGNVEKVHAGDSKALANFLTLLVRTEVGFIYRPIFFLFGAPKLFTWVLVYGCWKNVNRLRDGSLESLLLTL